jgi:hypothetical protein
LARTAVLTVASVCLLAASVGLSGSNANAQNGSPRQNPGTTQIANANTANANTSVTPPASAQPRKPASAQKSMANVRTPQATAGAQKRSPPPASRRNGMIRHYFVEFRARVAESYGHAYLVYGRADERGTIIQSTIAGLHPVSESVVPWLLGHIIPVPSETGASDGDTEEVYISARYRVLLSEADYQKTVAYIKKLQANNPLWHASLNNCIGFLKDVAHFMNLKTPLSTLVYPEVFVKNLREMNESSDHTAKTLIPRVQWGIQQDTPAPSSVRR